jgi:hypothetical protein
MSSLPHIDPIGIVVALAALIAYRHFRRRQH